jgi:hypothetical protein
MLAKIERYENDCPTHVRNVLHDYKVRLLFIPHEAKGQISVIDHLNTTAEELF